MQIAARKTKKGHNGRFNQDNKKGMRNDSHRGQCKYIQAADVT